MSEKWRLLITEPLPVYQNMTLQWVLLNSCRQNWAPNTLHLLQFKPHTALVGFHQSVELEVEEEYCREHNIEINRRISGGGCIYMDESQLGWEITAKKGTAGIPHNLNEMYRVLCECAIAGFAKLGVAAKYRPLNDIEVEGRKISGTAGTEYDDSFIFHGTLLTDFDVETMLRCLKLPLKKLDDKQVQSFKQRVVSLKELLGSLPDMQTIHAAVAGGFAEVLGIELVAGGLTQQEREFFEQEMPGFQSEAWVRGNRSIQTAGGLQVSDYKAPGGLIRISLLLDPTRQFIKSIFITGDFFAYPENAILGLEAFLKNTPIRSKKLEENVKWFFAWAKVRIPGVTTEDFISAIRNAVTEASVEGREVAIDG
ncbi:MAG: lipoate--protein ligase family protein [Clostridia bacterium]|jgi:lipoate-protein ligase A|nr:lipoate--protein ligase family protein [Clostridia bacterium]